MEQYVIVGGGVSGLLAAKTLERCGLPFIGLEMSGNLGGRFEIGHHRLYEPASVQLFSTLVENLNWIEIQEPAMQRRKGNWVDIDEEFSDEENFYVRSPYFAPNLSLADLVQNLSKSLVPKFQFRKTVIGVDPEKKIITCQDASQIPYDKLIWCSSLESLKKVWNGDKSNLLKVLGKDQDLPGGINLDIELGTNLLPLKNSMIFPFRFKDHKLRAIGSQKSNSVGNPVLHWLLFLPEEISEDREEVAKCVRALRRELEKEFPELKGEIRSERIVYLSAISGEKPRATQTLNLLPRLYYLGPELTLREKNTPMRNLDVIADNCLALQSTLST